MQLLVAAPTQYEAKFNPIALVRAVNYLHGMGKGDAIQALRKFAVENPNDGSPLSDHQSLVIVIPLLFDRIDPEDRFADTHAYDDPGDVSLELDEWPIWVCCQQDLPFRWQEVPGYSGFDADRTYLIDWAERHARLRTTPLRPADDPLAAAEQLLARLFPKHEERKEWDRFLIRQVRGDAFRAVAHLVVLDQSDERSWAFPSDEEWTRLKERCRKLGIRWSEERQEYVATKAGDK